MAKKYRNPEIEPDEIFGDALNIPGFNENQFEGRLEKPIAKNSIVFLGLFFLLIGGIFTARAFTLGVVKGDEYKNLSENNRLHKIPIFADRGVVYDRTGKELAWNTDNKNQDFFDRAYAKIDGLGHVLGFVSAPKLDSSGRFWQTEMVGKDGLERFYNDIVGGKNGEKIIEFDVHGEIVSESLIYPPKKGENLNLSLDARLNEKLFQAIKELSGQVGFAGGAGIMMDVKNGEILALSSFPEYSPKILAQGGETAVISGYVKDKKTPFLNRVTTGLYAPGSIIKPFMALGALSEGVITPEKKILSTGSISIPNPYFPDKPSVFKDWKVHGWVDMREAIAQSSDVYFYEIGGGYQDQKGLGILNIEKYARMFGLGAKTGVDLPTEEEGVIPSPEWKAKNFNGEKWLLGNTYHTAIGQYGFQVTPIQIVRYVAAVANGGTLLTPHLVSFPINTLKSENIPIAKDYFTIVREGMKKATEIGTAKGLYFADLSIGAKTGTAEIGLTKDKVNSWVVGFFPYDNPKYAFTVVMERGPVANTLGGVYVMRQVLEWMIANTPEYLK